MPPLSTAAYVSILFTHATSYNHPGPQDNTHCSHWHIHAVKNTMMINRITNRCQLCECCSTVREGGEGRAEMVVRVQAEDQSWVWLYMVLQLQPGEIPISSNNYIIRYFLPLKTKKKPF